MGKMEYLLEVGGEMQPFEENDFETWPNEGLRVWCGNKWDEISPPKQFIKVQFASESASVI